VYEVYVNGVAELTSQIAPTADTQVTVNLPAPGATYIYEVAVHQTNPVTGLFGFACNAMHNPSITINGVAVAATGANGVYLDATQTANGDLGNSFEPFDLQNVFPATGQFTGGAQRYFLGSPMPKYQVIFLIP
jgi:hypothetical protein